MSDKQKPINRIPFETLEESSVVSAWDIPALAAKKSRKMFSARSERKPPPHPATDGSELIEDYQGSVKPKLLTAQELQQMAEEAKQEGFQQGYEEGLAQGLEDGQAKGEKEGHDRAYRDCKGALDQQSATFLKLSQQLLQPMQEQEAHLEKIIVDMAMHFAGQLLQREIASTPQAILDLVKKALLSLPAGSRNITVFVSTDDAALIEQALPSQQRSWQVKEDNSIQTGGCRVETLESLVDYTVAGRMQKFLAQVLESGEVAEGDVPPLGEFPIAAETPEPQALDSEALELESFEPETVKVETSEPKDTKSNDTEPKVPEAEPREAEALERHASDQEPASGEANEVKPFTEASAEETSAAQNAETSNATFDAEETSPAQQSRVDPNMPSGEQP